MPKEMIQMSDDEIIAHADAVRRCVEFEKLVQISKDVYGPRVHRIVCAYDRMGIVYDYKCYSDNGETLAPDPRSAFIKNRISLMTGGYFSGTYIRGRLFHDKIRQLYYNLDNDIDAGELEDFVLSAATYAHTIIPVNTSRSGDVLDVSINDAPVRPAGQVFLQTGE